MSDTISTARAEELARRADDAISIGGFSDEIAAALRSLARERDELLDHKAMLLTTVKGLQERAKAAERGRDELRAPLCIGQKTIERLAREGAIALDSGHSLVAADDLFHADPYADLAAERQRAEKALAYLENGDYANARAALADEREEGK